jgi:flagellin FlaB
MIVFIAMILVAGIAASVLVQTSNTVQIQALQTGQQTTREVSSGISVFGITGQKGTNGLQRIAFVVRPRAGSPDVDLNNTYILISDGQEKSLLVYGGYNDDDIWKDDASGNYFGTGIIANFTNCTEEIFGIGVLQDYDNSMSQTNPVINRGDKAILYIRCSSSNNGLFNREIPVRTEISGRVIPEVGSPGVISFTSPMSYVDTIYKLQ